MAQKKKRRRKASEKRPISELVEICLDWDLEAAFEEAEQALDKAKERQERVEAIAAKATPEEEAVASFLERAQREVDAAQAAFDKAQQARDDEVWSARVVGLHREVYANLMADHPATEEQLEETAKIIAATGITDKAAQAVLARESLDYNPDTFLPALLKMTLRFDPPVSQEEIEEEVDFIFGPDSTWTNADVKALSDAAVRVCNKSSIIRR